MPAYEPWDAVTAEKIIAEHRDLDGATLPILHALLEAFGYVPQEAIALVADALNLSRAEVYGAMTFYHDFRSEPAGRHVLKLCRAEACQSMGAVKLHEAAMRRLGIDWNGTTADGRITLEPVFCLGLCACAPAAMMDGEPIARLDEASLEAVLDGAEA